MTRPSDSSALEAEYQKALSQLSLRQPAIPVPSSVIERVAREIVGSADREGLEQFLTPEEADQVLRSAPITMPSLLDTLKQEVEDAIRNIGIDVPVAVLVREWPKGTFNAEVRPTPAGALVLVHLGLPMLIYQAAKVFAFCVPIPDFSSAGEPIPGTARDSGFSRPEIVDALVRIILAYLLFQEPRLAKRYSAQTGARGALVASLTHEAEKFVVAHEYGHILAGHDPRWPTTAALDYAHADTDQVPLTWAQELEADGLGFVLAQRGTPREISDRRQFAHVQAVLAGPHFYLALSEMIDQVQMRLSNRTRNWRADHPPPVYRARLMRENMETAAPSDLLGLATACTEWAADLTTDVADRARQVVDELGFTPS
jgi:hypothetical protein